MFYMWRLHIEVQPLNRLRTIFDRKGTPFKYLGSNLGHNGKYPPRIPAKIQLLKSPASSTQCVFQRERYCYPKRDDQGNV